MSSAALPPSAVAASPNLAILQQETFDVKTWLNNALLQQHVAVAAASGTPVTSPVSNGAHSAGHDSAIGTSNGTASGGDNLPPILESDEARVGKLFTRMQVHHQEVSSSLEDLISQALVRLPRTALEVERMTVDTATLTTQLVKVVDFVKPQIMALPEKAKEIAALDKARAKLLFCSQYLQTAKVLSLQLEELEAAAKVSTPAAAGASSNTTDTQRVDTFADAISEIQESLRKIQIIDPTYGGAIQQRITNFEIELQKSIERECLELLRKQDKRRAPMLLSTLRKIGRDGAVMEEFVLSAVKARRDQFTADLRNIAAGNAQQLVVLLLSHYKAIARAISRESVYLREIFEGREDFGDVVGRKIGKAFLDAATTSLLTSKLQQLPTNAAVVQCFLTIHELKDLQNKPLDFAMADAAAPFLPLVSVFLSRESEFVKASVQAIATPKEFPQLLDALDQSVERCAGFMRAQTLPVQLPVILQSLETALAALGDARPAGPSAGVAMLNQLLMWHTSMGALRAPLSSYEATFTARVSELIPDPNVIVSIFGRPFATPSSSISSLPSSGAAASIMESAGPLSKCIAALGGSLLRSEVRVRECLLVPVDKLMLGYEAWTYWTEGKTGGPSATRGTFSAGESTPSEILRGVCEALMEVPMSLEAVDVDAAEMQSWLARVVDASVATLQSTLAKITLTGSHSHICAALDQLATDVEYYNNVLNAVSEGTFAEVAHAAHLLRSAQQARQQMTALPQAGTQSVRLAHILTSAQ